jgi:hypothetical protein
MDVKRLFLFILIIYLTAFIVHGLYLGKTVYGDGIFYFSQVRSIFVDHDINFTDEYKYFQVSQPKTDSGLPGNKYAIGPTLFWSPIYLIVKSTIGGNGYGFPYQLVIGIVDVFAALTGLILIYRLLLFYYPAPISQIVIICCAFATNLFFYGSIDSVNSHAVSFLAVSVFLSLTVYAKKMDSFLIGLSLGFIGLMRMQDLIFGLILILIFKKIQLIKIILGFTLGLLPQLIFWQILYERFWISPYLINGEYFNFFNPHILPVLFQPPYGLFIWTPILIVGIAGFFLFEYPKHKLVKIVFPAIIIGQIYLVSSWSTWWQGASYGGRMFVSSIPLLAFGISEIFKRFLSKIINFKFLLLTIVTPLCFINLIAIVYFLYIN